MPWTPGAHSFPKQPILSLTLGSPGFSSSHSLEEPQEDLNGPAMHCSGSSLPTGTVFPYTLDPGSKGPSLHPLLFPQSLFPHLLVWAAELSY